MRTECKNAPIGGIFEIWYMCLNICFKLLNNIICIFTHFFTHMYFQKIQIKLLDQHYQTDPHYKRILKNTIIQYFLCYNSTAF